MSAALQAVYVPWLEEANRRFQDLVHKDGYPGSTVVEERSGTYQAGGECWLSGRPPRPAGSTDQDFVPSHGTLDKPLNTALLRKALKDGGWQVPGGSDTGDPTGRALALEVRRRVKEQQKRIGSAEFRNTHFSYFLGGEGVEKFVPTPELSSENSIGAEPLEPGQVWTLSPGGMDERPGLFRIEVNEGPGSGLRILNKPTPSSSRMPEMLCQRLWWSSRTAARQHAAKTRLHRQ